MLITQANARAQSTRFGTIAPCQLAYCGKFFKPTISVKWWVWSSEKPTPLALGGAGLGVGSGKQFLVDFLSSLEILDFLSLVSHFAVSGFFAVVVLLSFVESVLAVSVVFVVVFLSSVLVVVLLAVLAAADGLSMVVGPLTLI